MSRDFQARIELGERLEGEGPLVEPRVRDGQAGLVHDLLAVEQEVEIDRPRPVFRALAGSAEDALDGEEGFEQLAGAQIGLERCGGVEEAWLLADPDRLGLAEARDARDLDARRRVETRERQAQRLLAITEVRAQADVRARHAGERSRAGSLGRLKLGVVLAVVLGALAVVPAALAARAQEPPSSGPGLLELPGYDHALIELKHGTLAAEGGELVSARLGIWRLRTAAALRVLPRLLEAGAVEAVQPDRPLRYAAVSADPFSHLEWWRPVVGADRVAPPGPGKPLTVIDSGLDVRHPEFRGRPNTILLNPQVPQDEAHGTSVSSVAAAPENGIGIVGVYPQVVLRSWDAGLPHVSDVIAGIEAASNAGPGVINLSLGFSERDPMLEQEVLLAFGTGSVIVAAAGNDRAQGSPEQFPANLNHVLTVAATDQAGNISGFSSASLGVDLAAPGVDIPAAHPVDGYIFANGTSFSAPIVAAATAWVWTVRSELDNTQVFDLMRYSARDIGARGFDADSGFGLLDIPNALSQAAPSSDPQEPNEDIAHVRANGLFRQATRPVTTPARGRASLRARLDVTEDPEDVYRVWVPAQRVVRVTVRPDTDVDVDFWNATTRTVLARGAERRRHLLATSARRGRAVERVVVRNRGRRGFYGYLDVFLRANGPGDAEYTVTISTARR